MLTALVVDDSTAARHRVATLLQLAGWRVLEVTDPGAALRAATRISPDLVVTELRMRGGSGLALLQHLRHGGSHAQFLVTTARPSARTGAQAAALGAACLAKPIDPRQLVDFLRGRTTGPAPQDTATRMRVTAERVAPPAVGDEPGWRERQHDFFLSALPHQLAMIAHSAKAGNASAVATAAHTLADESGQNGHPEVATVCRTVVADAERGVVSQSRLIQLVTLAAMAGAR